MQDMVMWATEIVGLTVKQLVINIILAAVLIILGIVLGKFVKYIFKKIHNTIETIGPVKNNIGIFT